MLVDALGGVVESGIDAVLVIVGEASVDDQRTLKDRAPGLEVANRLMSHRPSAVA